MKRSKLVFNPNKDTLSTRVWEPEVPILDEELVDVTNIQRLNDRKGDDKWLGWLHRGAVVEGIKKGDVLVLRDRDQIVGFLVGNSRRDGVGRVNSICVAEEYRQYGLGKVLMEHFLQKQPEKKVLLKVMHLNFTGVAFFTKLGGIPIDVQINKHNNILIELEFTEIK